MTPRRLRTLIAGAVLAVGGLGLTGCHVDPVAICAASDPGPDWHVFYATWGKRPGETILPDHYRCGATHFNGSYREVEFWCVLEVWKDGEVVGFTRIANCT